MAIQHIELKMGTTQNDATNMMIDVSPFYEVAFSRRFL